MSKNSSAAPDFTGGFIGPFFIAFAGFWGALLILGGILSMDDEPASPAEDTEIVCSETVEPHNC